MRRFVDRMSLTLRLWRDRDLAYNFRRAWRTAGRITGASTC